MVERKFPRVIQHKYSGRVAYQFSDTEAWYGLSDESQLDYLERVPSELLEPFGTTWNVRGR